MRYWVIGTDEGTLWNEFHDEGSVYIGQGKLGDLRQYHSKREVAQGLRLNYDEYKDKDKNPARKAGPWYDFAHTVKIGDRVFAKTGRTRLVGFGEFRSDYFFDPGRPITKPNSTGYFHGRKVRWLKAGDFTLPKDVPQFTISTLTEELNGPRLDALRAFFEPDGVASTDIDSPIIETIEDRIEREAGFQANPRRKRPMTYYEALGVSPNATEVETEAAFQQRRQQYPQEDQPPDPRYPHAGAEPIFRAYAVLRDPQHRKQYDASLIRQLDQERLDRAIAGKADADKKDRRDVNVTGPRNVTRRRFIEPFSPKEWSDLFGLLMLGFLFFLSWFGYATWGQFTDYFGHDKMATV